jgi:hypothetical protein
MAVALTTSLISSFTYDLQASDHFKCAHILLTAIVDASPPLLNSASLTAIYEQLVPN